MRIIELYRTIFPVFSIEIFPPKTQQGVENLKTRLIEYKKFAPDFISVTYGAGGSTRHNTHHMVSYVKNELGIEAMAHLTCVAHTQNEIDLVLDDLERADIENIMALRGDPPQGADTFIKPYDGFGYANELIEALVQRKKFGIGAAGYPEGHIEAKTPEEDRYYLINKIKAGAEYIISQFFLENDFFLKWRDLLRADGVTAPLIPGILPAQSAEQITRFASMNGCHIPSRLLDSLKKHENDTDAMRQIGRDFAQRQIEDLLKEGVEGIHLYALNRLDTVAQLAPVIIQTRKNTAEQTVDLRESETADR